MTTTHSTDSYEVQLARVNEKFDDLPWGSKTQAAIALQMSSSYVSNVLNGHVRAPEILALLEDWVDETSPDDVVMNKRATRMKAKRREDAIAWLELRLAPNPETAVRANALHTVYEQHALESGQTPLGFWSFFHLLERWGQTARSGGHPSLLEFEFVPQSDEERDVYENWYEHVKRDDHDD